MEGDSYTSRTSITSQEMVALFIDMLQPPFYEHMIGNVSYNFADMVRERTEFGRKSGKIAHGPLRLQTPKGPDSSPKVVRRVKSRRRPLPLIRGVIPHPTLDQVINRSRCISLLLQIQQQYTIHGLVHKVSLGPRPRIKSHLCQIRPTTMVLFHIPIKVKAKSRPQREIQKETSSTSLPFR